MLHVEQHRSPLPAQPLVAQKQAGTLGGGKPSCAVQRFLRLEAQLRLFSLAIRFIAFAASGGSEKHSVFCCISVIIMSAALILVFTAACHVFLFTEELGYPFLKINGKIIVVILFAAFVLIAVRCVFLFA